MARWGEGDPRWIVEERPDATNVNNWHWAEKNADSWSRQKIKDLFSEKQLSESGVVHITIEGVESCEGEARVNNRKGKIIVFFEWNIVLTFKGPLIISRTRPYIYVFVVAGFVSWLGKEVRGKLEILNFSEDIDDLELRANVLLDPQCSVALTNIIKKGAISADIRESLEEYVTSLKAHYNPDGVLLPVKTTVKSRTVISETKPGEGKGEFLGVKSPKKTVSRGRTKKNKKKKSDDFLFYLSLISIVGFSAVLVIKIVNRL